MTEPADAEADARRDAPWPPMPPVPLPGAAVQVLGLADAPRLQAFYDANPAYFQATTGAPATADDGLDTLAESPPADWPWSGRWVITIGPPDGQPLAMAEVVRDMLAPGVWHIGLFIVETARHGSGDAAALMAWLQAGLCAQGAQWLRLGVVVGNTRAERFWRRQGFIETRQREGVSFGALTHTVRVMVKPLAGGGLADYLARVPRDRAEG